MQGKTGHLGENLDWANGWRFIQRPVVSAGVLSASVDQFPDGDLIGKGGIDREVPLSKKLLGALREYYRWMRPQTYLFPGTVNNWRADKPITEKIVWQAVREASIRAGIKKRVTPHTLRHCFATHLLESGADLRSIQMMLGHSDLEATTVYLHLSRRHLQATANPLEQISVSNPAKLPRSRRLRKPQ